jgi:hypothetical protein
MNGRRGLGGLKTEPHSAKLRLKEEAKFPIEIRGVT